MTSPASWKYGGGNSESTAAELKASGELAIEAKGRQAKVNASEDSLAIHVARDGNDVVKRESALTMKADATENDGSEATNQEVDSVIKQNGQRSYNAPEANKEEPTPATGDNSATANVTDEPEQPGDKINIALDAEKVKAGEKRCREDDDSGEAQNDEEQGEKENRNASKKTKLGNGDAAENGHHTENGYHAENGHHAESGHAHNKDGDGAERPITEEETPKKTKGPGRPKKTDVDAKHVVDAEGDGSTIARRTRSKA